MSIDELKMDVDHNTESLAENRRSFDEIANEIEQIPTHSIKEIGSHAASPKKLRKNNIAFSPICTPTKARSPIRSPDRSTAGTPSRKCSTNKVVRTPVIEVAPPTQTSHSFRSSGPLADILELSKDQFSYDDIPKLQHTLQHIHGITEGLYAREYTEMRENLIENTNRRLGIADLCDAEQADSQLYPKKCLSSIESFSEVDKNYMKVLLNSARIQECKLPEYDSFARAPKRTGDGLFDATTTSEFQFEIGFTFGFPVQQIREIVNKSTRKFFPDSISDIVTDFVGDSFFKVKLTVYFDKFKKEWNEQDGEAWIWINEYKNMRKEPKQRDVVNFDKEERIYYVEDWPLKGLVLDASESSREDKNERRMTAWLCCQIVWFALGQNLDHEKCHSVSVRNMMRKLLFVLKGWFTGLLLGEPFEPKNITFEYDNDNAYTFPANSLLDYPASY